MVRWKIFYYNYTAIVSHNHNEDTIDFYGNVAVILIGNLFCKIYQKVWIVWYILHLTKKKTV